MHHRSKLRQGLTLIELVVVVGVIGLLITITATSIKNFIRPSTEDIAQKFSDILKFAYNTAQISHSTVIVQIDLTKNNYRVFKLVRREGGLEEVMILKPRSFPNSARVISVVDLRGNKTEEGIFQIPFSHGGRSIDLSIHIGTEGRVLRTIVLQKYGGKITIIPGEFHKTSKTSMKVDYGIDERDETKSNANQF